MPATDVVRIERSPADILRLGVAAVSLLALLVVEWVFGDTLLAFGSDLLRGLDAVPQWIVDVVLIGTRLFAVALLGGCLVWTVAGRRWRMLVTITVAGVLAAGLAVLLRELINVAPAGDALDVSQSLGVLSSDGFPTAAGIGVVAAVTTAAAPWLSRGWRQAAWGLVVALTVERSLATPASFDSIEAAIGGWLIGAAALVVMGAPSRRPTTEAVIEGLGRVGLELATLQDARVDARGSTPYFGETTDGGKVFVKALGEDERSADIMFRLYRRLTPRDFGDEKPFTTLRRTVEHEALVALCARDLGMATPRMRAFATAEPNGFVLAYDAIDGRSLDRLDGDELTDEVLDGCWRVLGQLRDHRIAHRDLRLANIFLASDGTVALIDFGFSEMAASDLLLANDVAELVASSSLLVGAERAVAHAAETVDAVTLVRARGRLNPWSLSGATRAGLKARPGHLDELRRRVDDALAPTSAHANG